MSLANAEEIEVEEQNNTFTIIIPIIVVIDPAEYGLDLDDEIKVGLTD